MLFSSLACGEQFVLNMREVAQHRLAGAFHVAFLDRAYQDFVLPEAVMVLRRARGLVAQATPDDGPAYGIQRVEQSEQNRVVRGLSDCSVQPGAT